MAMLLSQSETAKFIRHVILDTAIDIIAEREGCHTSYVERSIEYLHPLVKSHCYSYTDVFIEAIEQYVSSVSVKQNFRGKDFKFSEALFYDRVYELIFSNKHKQYRQYLEHFYNIQKSIFKR